MNTHMIFNFIGFQVCWAACVWGGAQGYWWLGPAAVALFAAWELSRSAGVVLDLKLLSAVLVFGVILDTLYVQLGLLRYATPLPSQQIAPVWIWSMWIAFALTLNHSMAWLKSNMLLATVFGAIGGPFAYWVAAKAWDAVFIDSERTVMAYGIIAIAWAIACPVLLKIAAALDSKSDQLNAPVVAS